MHFKSSLRAIIREFDHLLFIRSKLKLRIKSFDVLFYV